MNKDDNRTRYIYEYDPLFKRKVLVAEGECLICKHCTDMYYDDTNGPYMACCEFTVQTVLGDEALSNLIDTLNDFRTIAVARTLSVLAGEREYKEI